MQNKVPVRIQTGAPVRIDGREYSAGPIISGGRIFFDKEGAEQTFISEVAQMRMALEFRLTDGRSFEKLSPSRQQTLKIDWGTFTTAERRTALSRALYIRKLDKVLPARYRNKKAIIQRIIDDVGTSRNVAVADRPSVRLVRNWYRTYIAAGRDVRALVDCNWAKGNRQERYPEWVIEEINCALNDKVIRREPSSLRVAALEAGRRIKERAAKEGLSVSFLGKTGTIGKNLVRRVFARRDRYAVLVAQVGEAEARRQLDPVELGPQGLEVNHEWEVDNTLLDVMVIDPDTGKAAGRPWMTAIIDRYSRCIVGFSIGFAPPSWVSVMDALRIAICKKDKIVDRLGGITNKWDCFGVPVTLITDHGRDFKSNSMKETEAALNFTLRHTLPKRPWLKGKIERWFKTIEEEIIHQIPGTTFAKWDRRKFYSSEKMAVLTIEELNWIVAKWVIDVYHQRSHSKTGRPPARMWTEGLRSIAPPMEPPAELLAPLMGLVVPRSLRKNGVRYQNLRWDSEAFTQLRRRLPSSADVLIRIDPMDLSTAYAWDPISKKWFKGHLKEPVEARRYTLDQWERIDDLRKELINDNAASEEEALATAMKEIDNYIKGVAEGRIKSKAPKRFAEYKYRSAWSKILSADWHGENDQAPGSHIIGVDELSSPPIAHSGPFEEVRHPPHQAGDGLDDRTDEIDNDLGDENASTDHTPLSQNGTAASQVTASRSVEDNRNAEQADQDEYFDDEDDDGEFGIIKIGKPD